MIARTVLVLSSCLLAVAISATFTAAEPAIDPVALGRQLFFDTNLSLRRTQSCATCHDPSRAFTDPRDNGVGGAASLGDDGKTLADRNAPTLTYIGLTPPFRLLEDGEYSGGFFLDGRARELAAQAAGPLLNPKEMALPDAAVLVARLREAPHYRALGTEVLADPTRARWRPLVPRWPRSSAHRSSLLSIRVTTVICAVNTN